MRPATTRSRSPPRSGVARSITRYCIGFVSGTRHLREKLLYQRARLALVPGALAEHVVAHAPARIDEERHGEPAHFPVLRDLVLRVEQDGHADSGAREVLVDLVGKL